MRYDRQLLGWVGVLLGTIMVLTGCIYNYDAAVRQLSPPEQAEFHTYRKIMTGAQTHTYLAKTSAAERTAYLQKIGLVQRFQRLDPIDRETVQNGFPRVGMSAEALRFVWGEPALLGRGCAAFRPLVLPGFVACTGGIWQSVRQFRWQSC